MIFDPYFTTKPTGNGLGLATAHAIVSKHGGQISVSSTMGEGSVFNIDLPASGERSAPRPSIVSELQMGTARVLVMDDDASIRYLLNAVLKTLGYEVQTAKDGAEAIAMYQHAKMSGRAFDLCLLDLTVSGGMGGVQTAQKIREIDPSSRLIVSSGYSDAPVMSDFASYGFDAVITKPATPAEVSAAITELLLRKHTPTSP
jgi:CheY-like chemotaxis protein